eukprot:TRINITY_DN178_c1_g1_i1.p1 TRINITY_DN178_c1_g1~~TRINITY_DN178_c1_g1_i1.p1  ORF type:complete len:292 (-),score=102.18 TRINITY_DN178_c1_g1_i1:240-1115(-)
MHPRLQQQQQQSTSTTPHDNTTTPAPGQPQAHNAPPITQQRSHSTPDASTTQHQQQLTHPTFRSSSAEQWPLKPQPSLTRDDDDTEQQQSDIARSRQQFQHWRDLTAASRESSPTSTSTTALAITGVGSATSSSTSSPSTPTPTPSTMIADEAKRAEARRLRTLEENEFLSMDTDPSDNFFGDACEEKLSDFADRATNQRYGKGVNVAWSSTTGERMFNFPVEPLPAPFQLGATPSTPHYQQQQYQHQSQQQQQKQQQQQQQSQLQQPQQHQGDNFVFRNAKLRPCCCCWV